MKDRCVYLTILAFSLPNSDENYCTFTIKKFFVKGMFLCLFYHPIFEPRSNNQSKVGAIVMVSDDTQYVK